MTNAVHSYFLIEDFEIGFHLSVSFLCREEKNFLLNIYQTVKHLFIDIVKKMVFEHGVVKEEDDISYLTLTFCESVRSIVSRSVPIPSPALGGRPISKAVQNISSRT